MKLVTGLSAHDSFELGSNRTITPEGFLEAPATIARSGVQLYRARELGLDAHGIHGDTVVRLHRPVEEMSSPDTVSSFEGKPVINGTHTKVTAKNWKSLAVGDMHGIHVNERLLDANKLVVRDMDAIGDISSGKKFLSIGYQFDVDLTPGVTADGQAYDGMQRNIKGNHVLITDAPRGGPVCSIADSTENFTQGVRTMKKITVNGVPVEVGDSEAGIIETLIVERDTARNLPVVIKLGDKKITGADAIVAEITTRDTRIAELTAQIPTEAQLEARVATRVAVVGDAAKLDPEYKPEGKTNRQVMVDVLTKVTSGDSVVKSTVDAVFNGVTIGDASDELLGAAFRSVASFKTVANVTGADAAVAAALIKKTDATTDNKPTGRDAFVERQNNAWKQ